MFPGGFGGPGGGFGGDRFGRGGFPPRGGMGGFYGDDDRLPGGIRQPFGGNPPMGPNGIDPMGPPGYVDIDLVGPTNPDEPPIFGMPDIPEFRVKRPRPDPDLPPQQNPLSNFAPPGTMPAVGSPNAPNLGVDGKGSLVVSEPKIPKPVARGDYDQMRQMGLIKEQDDGFNPNLYL